MHQLEGKGSFNLNLSTILSDMAWNQSWKCHFICFLWDWNLIQIYTVNIQIEQGKKVCKVTAVQCYWKSRTYETLFITTHCAQQSKFCTLSWIRFACWDFYFNSKPLPITRYTKAWRLRACCLLTTMSRLPAFFQYF